jgi:pyruvate ferredoxin oxidoreductase beta subunit
VEPRVFTEHTGLPGAGIRLYHRRIARATTKYAATTTTTVGEFSRGKAEVKKPLPLIVAMHRVLYTATASVAFPEDFIGKLQYAKPVKGFRFLQVSAPCPTGW